VIDLHSHVLPGVDDGARSVDQAIGAMRTLAEQGVTDLCLTPHLLASRAVDGVPPAHDRAFIELSSVAPAAPRLYRGAEIMLDRPLAESVGRRRDVTLAGSRFLLVEFMRVVPFETVSTALRRVVEVGLVPVLAHPERYSACSPAAVRRWREVGARMQIDAGTLSAHSNRGDRARQLVADGLADIIAGDNHGDSRSVFAGVTMLEEHGGEVQAELLGTTNPAAILEDGELQPVPPLPLKQSWLRRLRRLFEGEYHE
jgi:protein-tyrosine phosphatase